MMTKIDNRVLVSFLLVLVMLSAASLSAASFSPIGPDACPTDNPEVPVPAGQISGVGTSPQSAIAAALLQASGVTCEVCPDPTNKPCRRLVSLHNGTIVGGGFATTTVLGVTLYWFSGTLAGTYDVDCASCPDLEG